MRTLTAFAVVTVMLVGLALALASNEVEHRGQTPLVDFEEPPPLLVEEAPDAVDTDTKPGTALEVTGRLSHGTIPSASFDELYVEVSLAASERTPERRPPLNVALVIDRSGSMHGEPMVQAREAARTFVNGLGEQDRITLVAFDHESEVLVEPTAVTSEGRRRLHAAIDRIHAGGTTNISGGLRDGFEAVERQATDEMVNRVILMTDGIPNVGIIDHDGLAGKTRSIRQRGITVSTLGFGPSYDARLMGAMAEEGSGYFRHISNSADLELAFSNELNSLRDTVASGIEVEIRPRPGVKIERVIGFRSEEFSEGHRIAMGGMPAGGRLSAVVRLRIEELPVNADQPLVDVRTEYVDRLSERPARHQLAMAADVSIDQEAVEASVDNRVMARVEQLRTQDTIMEVMELYDRGEQQAATHQLERERRRIRQARQRYEIDEEEETAQQIDMLFDRVDDTVRNVPARSARGRNSAAEVQVESIQLYRGQ